MNLKEIYSEYIPKEVEDYAIKNAISSNLYVGWLCKFSDDVVLRIYAFRRNKKDGFQLQEVIRENTEGKIYRNMYLTAMAGWRVIYKPCKRTSSSWYGYQYYDISEEDFNHWDYIDKIGISYVILNLDFLQETKYRYSGYQIGVGMYLMSYLALWEKHPEVEYFGKLGICPKQTLLNKVKKDKGFAKFLWTTPNADCYTCQALIYAYDHHIDIESAQEYIHNRNQSAAWCKNVMSLQGTEIDKVKAYKYCKKNGISSYAYNDYLNAIINLGLDLSDTKNIYPRDFRRMHDLRTNEWGSKRAKINAQKFRKVADGLKEYEYSGQKYIIIIPKGVKELKDEGKALEHCVGKMGYDKKMLDGVSFIAFLRNKQAPDKPYVTIEYGLKEKRVLQCYGKNDSRPNEDVLGFVDAWAKEVRKKVI